VGYAPKGIPPKEITLELDGKIGRAQEIYIVLQTAELPGEVMMFALNQLETYSPTDEIIYFEVLDCIVDYPEEIEHYYKVVFIGQLTEGTIAGNYCGVQEIGQYKRVGSFTVTITPGITPVPTPAGHKLVAYYPFNGDTQDHSGNGNHGTNHGGTFVSGVSGKALAFNGKDAYVEVSRMVGGDFTLATWVKTDANSLKGTQCYQGNGLIWSDVGAGNNDFIMAVLNNKLCMFTGNPDKSLLSSSNIVTGDWIYVIVTREKLSGNVSVYIDGKRESSMIAGKNTLNANSHIHIGGNTLDKRFFKGTIDEVRIYNYALTADEIKANYDKLSLGGIAPPGGGIYAGFKLPPTEKWGR
jgi:hypothetical protein